MKGKIHFMGIDVQKKVRLSQFELLKKFNELLRQIAYWSLDIHGNPFGPVSAVWATVAVAVLLVAGSMLLYRRLEL